MFEFLQNQWVVGIGGGIISGIIVFFITKWVFQRKDNSKYLEQITSANMDIIRALKPYIAEKGLPEKEIIDAIIVSTARKYNVKSDELYSIRIVCEELIREIIENVYVSTDKKKEYAVQLKDYLQGLNSEQNKILLVSDIQNEMKNTESKDKQDYRRKMTSTLSMVISAFAGLLTVLSTFLVSDTFSTFPRSTYGIEMILVIVTVPLLMMVLSFVLIYTKRIISKKDSKNDKDDN